MHTRTNTHTTSSDNPYLSIIVVHMAGVVVVVVVVVMMMTRTWMIKNVNRQIG